MSEAYSLLDIETTGVNHLEDEIIEISIHKYLNDERVSTYHSYIKTNNPVNSRITAMTGITNEILIREGRELRQVLLEVKDFVRGSILVAHNGQAFDLRFLNRKCIENQLEKFHEPLIDTLVVAKRRFGDMYKSYSLKSMCERANIPYSENSAHNSEYDVQLLWKIFKFLFPS